MRKGIGVMRGGEEEERGKGVRRGIGNRRHTTTSTEKYTQYRSQRGADTTHEGKGELLRIVKE